MGIESVKSVSSYSEQGSSSSAATSTSTVSATSEASTSTESVTSAVPVVEATASASAENGSNEQNATGRENGQASNQQIRQAVDKINRSAVQDQREAVFGIHEDTNRVTIKIVDKDTKEVIREYPPEKTLDMIARVWEMAGLFVDEKR